MKAKTGQRWWYKSSDGEAILEVISISTKLLKVKIINVIKTKTYGFTKGVDAFLEFETKKIDFDHFSGLGTTGKKIEFKYLSNQEVPKRIR